jgi:pilus assembly protein CpaB
MKKLLKNRTLIGALCIFLSLVICFGLTPLFNSAMTAQTEIARVKSEIKKGELITADKLETVTVGSYNLPSEVLKKTEEISGKYALADLQKGDYVLSAKLSAGPLAEFEYLSTLDGTKQAMSVTIKSFAAGLSGKLEAGDIVTLIAADYGDRRETTMPPELQYMYVLAVTNEKGFDKEYADNTNSEDDEKELPSTLTVLVCSAQAELLADLENKGKLHVALVYRGAKEQARKFLDVQDKYIAGLQKGSETLAENTTGQEASALPNESQGGNAQ